MMKKQIANKPMKKGTITGKSSSFVNPNQKVNTAATVEVEDDVAEYITNRNSGLSGLQSEV